ncbi:MAG: DNA repair protein RecO (recombination protein O) [Paracoccaceae bacterium]|jgi:DNA repair protein RecO (recombination protein O)
MDWRDQGVLLSVRRHGESAAIIEVFTENKGRHAGVVRGGAGRKLAPVLQPGAQLDVEWRARLEDHLGAYKVEPIKSRAALVMDDRTALAALNAVCGLLKFALPEREAHARLYAASLNFLDLLGDGQEWHAAYLAWELLLLEDLGYGLDLSSCAVTGVREGLEYVSPKTGRAVCGAGAGDWVEQLLAYPDPNDLLSALHTTGFFLEHWLACALGDRPLPDARARLIGRFEKEIS